MDDSNRILELLSMLFNLGALLCGFLIIRGFLQEEESPRSQAPGSSYLTMLREARRNAEQNVERQHGRTRKDHWQEASKPYLTPVRKSLQKMKSLEIGEEGEHLVQETLERLDGNNRILANLYLPQKAGRTTEVDLVMVNSKGVHVFESKSYSGWIFGNEHNRYWTQALRGGKKNRFYNPIWQNGTHIRALRRICPDLPETAFFSYIVFSDRCGLKELHVKSREVFVGNRYELVRLFSSAVSQKPDRLSEAQVDEAYATLRKYIHVDEETKRNHIRKIEDRLDR